MNRAVIIWLKWRIHFDTTIPDTWIKNQNNSTGILWIKFNFPGSITPALTLGTAILEQFILLPFLTYDVEQIVDNMASNVTIQAILFFEHIITFDYCGILVFSKKQK